MEKSEALLYLPLSEENELQDLYEEKLFEWKNFFVNRFPIPKLFRKKLVQLERLEQAYQTLGGESVEEVVKIKEAIQFESNFKDAFQKFSIERNKRKQEMFAATSVNELMIAVESLLELTAAYAKIWNDEQLEVTGIVVSKELDPMELRQAILDAETKGVTTIQELSKLSEDHRVINEAKRLSLWAKMENE